MTPSIDRSIKEYEKWLTDRLPIVRADLALKRRKIARSPFAFLRGTFFRWVECWPVICADEARAPLVLGVGDLHVSNFGTWRDAEARLVWGINDFDEAARLPYTNDLIRLCASAILAIEEIELRIRPRELSEAILSGYRDALKSGGGPTLLEQHHGWLRDLAAAQVKEGRQYWDKLSEARPVRERIRPEVRRELIAAMPAREIKPGFFHRQGGLGSLGRQRYLALAEWAGGPVAREAKALTMSAWYWRTGAGPARTPFQLYRLMCASPTRTPDPFMRALPNWVVRRLAPDCHRIELAEIPHLGDVVRLFARMGWETAGVHLATPRARSQILDDLRQRKPGWLERSAERMAESVRKDWSDI